MSFVYPINLPQQVYICAIVKGEEQVLPVAGWSPSQSGFMSHIQLYCKEQRFDDEVSYAYVTEQTVQWWRVGLDGDKHQGTGGLLEALRILKRKPHTHLHKWENVVSVSKVERDMFSDDRSQYSGMTYYKTYSDFGCQGGYFVSAGQDGAVYKVHRELYQGWIVTPLKNTVLEFEEQSGGRGRLRLIEVVEILTLAPQN